MELQVYSWWTHFGTVAPSILFARNIIAFFKHCYLCEWPIHTKCNISKVLSYHSFIMLLWNSFKETYIHWAEFSNSHSLLAPQIKSKPLPLRYGGTLWKGFYLVLTHSNEFSYVLESIYQHWVIWGAVQTWKTFLLTHSSDKCWCL